MPQTPFLWYHIYICFPEIWCRFYLPWTPYYHLQHITPHSRQIYSQISIHMFTYVSIPSHLLKKNLYDCLCLQIYLFSDDQKLFFNPNGWLRLIWSEKTILPSIFFWFNTSTATCLSQQCYGQKKPASKQRHIYLSTIKKYILMKIIRKKNSALHSPYKIYITSKQKHRKLFPTINILPKKNLYYIITVPIPMFLPAKSYLPPPLPPFFTINTI